MIVAAYNPGLVDQLSRTFFQMRFPSAGTIAAISVGSVVLPLWLAVQRARQGLREQRTAGVIAGGFAKPLASWALVISASFGLLWAYDAHSAGSDAQSLVGIVGAGAGKWGAGVAICDGVYECQPIRVKVSRHIEYPDLQILGASIPQRPSYSEVLLSIPEAIQADSLIRASSNGRLALNLP